MVQTRGTVRKMSGAGTGSATTQVTIQVSKPKGKGGRPRISQMRQSNVVARANELEALLESLQGHRRKLQRTALRHKRVAHHAKHMAGRTAMLRAGHVQHAQHYKARAKSYMTQMKRASARGQSTVRNARAVKHATLMRKRTGRKVAKLVKMEAKHLQKEEKYLEHAKKIEEQDLGRLDKRIKKVQDALVKLKQFRVSAAQRAHATAGRRVKRPSSHHSTYSHKSSGSHKTSHHSSGRRSSGSHKTSHHSSGRKSSGSHKTSHRISGSSSKKSTPTINVIVENTRPRRAAATAAMSRMQNRR